jgi:hypothetical protein
MVPNEELNGSSPAPAKQPTLEEAAAAQLKQLVLVRSSTTPNPKPGRRSKLESQLKDPTYCFCHKPDDGSPMVLCNSCKIWFHCSCLNINSFEFDQIGNSNGDWYCPECLALKTKSSQQSCVSCPHCPSDLLHKTYKGEKGLRRHIKAAHKDILQSTQQESQLESQLSPNSDDIFHITLSKARRNIKLLRQIPKRARMFAADKWANLIFTALEKLM